MTKKLYYDFPQFAPDASHAHCDATVTDCRPCEGGYEVLPDATVLFPEGGGQLSDEGRVLNQAGEALARISHAREEGDAVWHTVDTPLTVGSRVQLELDIESRQDHTQQHSGEHILSGLANTLFGAVNVGFHMAKEYATLDLDIFLEEEQLAALQREANRAVQADTSTVVRLMDAGALAEIPLRKQAQGLQGEVRIVYVGGVDSCTCCGTHVTRSGEIGYIKIIAAAKYKGGTRIWFACGLRAVEDSLRDKATVDKLARRFSAKPEDVLQAVLRQGEELAALKREYRGRTSQLLELRAEALLRQSEAIGGITPVFALLTGFDVPELKALAEMLCARDGVLALLFSQKDGTLYYQLARSQSGVNVSARELCAAINGLSGGRGGGRDDLAQGSAPLTPSMRAEDTLEQTRAYCLKLLQEYGRK
ncbi:MAG: alanyl-tRNA editing protein [Christensenellaceae bacterium]|jgi:alanyl-tRNA synthetase|nr:alanyl-tRNA editing protein [Christensenellaceae bacterium]